MTIWQVVFIKTGIFIEICSLLTYTICEKRFRSKKRQKRTLTMNLMQIKLVRVRKTIYLSSSLYLISLIALLHCRLEQLDLLLGDFYNNMNSNHEHIKCAFWVTQYKPITWRCGSDHETCCEDNTREPRILKKVRCHTNWFIIIPRSRNNEFKWLHSCFTNSCSKDKLKSKCLYFYKIGHNKLFNPCNLTRLVCVTWRLSLLFITFKP